MTFKYILNAIRLLLITSAIYILTFAPFILAGHTWVQWWELHRQMWYYHTHLVATHGYQSTPLQWLFDVRPVWYYVKYSDQYIENIYVIGNPLILWLGLVGLVIQLKKILNFKYSFFLVLYLIFSLPWVFSPRIMFFYHYLASATFLCVILAYWLVSFCKKSALFLLLLCFFSWILISPLLYGFPMPPQYWHFFFQIFPNWR